MNELIIIILIFLLVVFLFSLLVISVKKEIRERKKIKNIIRGHEEENIRLQELDHQKSEFVSLASHQLRGPLTSIKGYASMLLDGDFGQISNEAKDAISKIYASSNDLVVLVGDYLDVSIIEQGRMQYTFKTFDLRELIEDVIAEFNPRIKKANLVFKFDYDLGSNYLVNADQGKIKQVIGNLIDNSIKYTPQGTIHVWLTHGGGDAKKILLSISDTGIGIEQAILPRLFEKFIRSHDAAKTNIMGIGLGLYIAKKIIEAHDGKIWVESAGSGKGSSFFVEIKNS